MNSSRPQRSLAYAFLFVLTLVVLNGCDSGPRWSETESGIIRTVTNRGGQTLGYVTTSGVSLLTVDRFAFKDLNQNGELDPYEDWRLSADERARDLASRMSVQQIAGLMLYSAHQAIPAAGGRFGAATYDGKPFAESGANAWDLSDAQKDFLTNDDLRHVLITSVESPEVAARWNNNVQALAEGIGLGIPANNSSDPRHRTRADAEYNAGSGGDISMWPGSIGLAATFDPAVVQQFGEIASKEYRALGITTALSPQIDLSTEPRWYRFSGTFGEDPALATEMARAYVDGFQTSEGDAIIEGGWGYESVNAMVKHWPGGGPGEAGRDAHYGFGKYAVYPGNNFDMHLLPFTEGAFKLEGETEMATAVMPYYTISFNQDTVHGENVGNAYSTYMITDLLRGTYGFDGVVCTDWGVTRDHTGMDRFGATPWGVEGLSEAERHYKMLMAGGDQFGGNNDAGPVVEAYQLGVEEHGEEFMRARFEVSAVRLLKNIFRTGLFENPYLDVEETAAVVGQPEYMTTGYEAQLKSLVLLKNQDNVLPLSQNATVYIPQRYVPESRSFRGTIPARTEDAINLAIASEYFTVTDDPSAAEAAIVVINSPESGVGYDAADVETGGNGYLPISLQYGTYTATHARATSIAGGDPLETFTNRSYRGKTVSASNVTDMQAVLDASEKMNGKPVIVVLNISKPTVVSELEPSANAILVSFGVQDQAILDILTGAAEPSGLLPLQMPANMQTVEEQYEDTPHDMQPYVDSEGNAYDFAFGLNWDGVIQDDRTVTYGRGGTQ
ncbi:MAG: glycoside hydrolase family 3 C-terminal domain-containing protein [Gemmatimonadota bacterium]|nr:MAG: glycoside hydrolase family 3 C-terminal domain-containing protein [Gemmatimonadota bacterium]